MPSFALSIRPHVDREIDLAWRAFREDRRDASFQHLERAHVLGQASTREHVRVHLHMLVWSTRKRSLREFLGQLLRVVGAATKTPFGLVPTGNTGGSQISPFKPLPIPPDLAQLIASAEALNPGEK